MVAVSEKTVEEFITTHATKEDVKKDKLLENLVEKEGTY